MITEHFKNKYGEKITKTLLENNNLIAENISHRNENSQNLVKEQISKLNNQLDLNIDIKNTNWAFDFPGWLSQLSTQKEGAKKIMIIGLEPHVERYDYQITYGLSNKTPSNSQRFKIDLKNNFEIVCQDDSSLIWTNLFKILANDSQLKAVLENGNEKVMFDFLNQFYITDLCHFAPQDKAKAINDVGNWKKIRLKVAKQFMHKEIDLVQPKIILTQGNQVFNELKRVLKFQVTENYPLKFGKNTWSIKTGICPNNKYKVISIPHFGSLLNYKTFYIKNRQLVREQLFANNLIN